MSAGGPGPDDVAEPAPAGRPAGTLPDVVTPAVDAVPGLLRIAASTWWHTTEWGIRASWRTAGRVVRAATDREQAEALVHDVGETALSVADVARSLSLGVPLPTALARLAPTPVQQAVGGVEAVVVDAVESAPPADPEADLRRRGQELLERSRDVWNTDVAHPAYERILGDLAPDEARVLVLLLRGGPQPSVDVRTGGPIGMVSSQLIAPGLTMIGARAGCRHVDQVPSYLNNLFRLGLVWFSREALRDPMDYQVLEAQPDVLAAMQTVKFPKVVRRSIHLTPFGDDFARTCFLDEDSRAAALPAHAAPPEPDQDEVGSRPSEP